MVRLWPLFLLSILLCGCGHDDSQPVAESPKQVRGLALLAYCAPTFDRSAALRALDASPHPGLAVLFGTFNDHTRPEDFGACLKTFTDHFAARPHVLRVYAIDETWRDDQGAWYPGRLFPGVSVAELDRKILARDPAALGPLAQRFAAIRIALDAAVNANTTATLVPFLEHPISDAAANIAAEIAQSVSGYRVELNPLHPPQTPQSYKLEAHGDALCSDTTPVSSQDGKIYSEATTVDYLAAHANCREIYLWRTTDQGLSDDRGTIVKPPGDPRKRTFRFEHEREYAALLAR